MEQNENIHVFRKLNCGSSAVVYQVILTVETHSMTVAIYDQLKRFEEVVYHTVVRKLIITSIFLTN